MSEVSTGERRVRVSRPKEGRVRGEHTEVQTGKGAKENSREDGMMQDFIKLSFCLHDLLQCHCPKTRKGMQLWVMSKGSQGSWKPRWGERTVLSYSHPKSLQVRGPPRQKLLPIWPQCHLQFIGPLVSRDAFDSAEAREDLGTMNHSNSPLQEIRSAAPSYLRTHNDCRFHQISLIFHYKLPFFSSTRPPGHFSLPYSWWCKSKDWARVSEWCQILSPLCQRRKWMEVGHTWICRDKEQNHNSNVRCASGESSPLPFSTVGAQREQDDAIGDKQQREDYDADKPTVGHHQKAKHTSVSAGQL